jgi:ABC-2 type transport system permease protein
MKDLKKHFLTTFIIGAVLLAGIAVLINMIFYNINIGRFDLTADHVYKLSPSVKKILSQLEAPIEVTYYVSSSEKMPTQWKNLERDVIDKLKELKMASSGMLDYTVFDPSAEEEKEAYEEAKQEESEDDKNIIEREPEKITRKKIAERLYEKGVIPFGVQSTERDEFAVKRVYSSIVLSYLDRKEDVIQEVRPENFGNLEYDILSRTYKLISNKRPRIGFYPSQPEIPPQYRQYYRQGPPPDMYEFTAKLLRESGYDVTRTNIKKDDPIPDDIQTMILMIDQPLNERQMYEIDKLINKGVRILIAAQQYNYQISPARDRPGEFDLRGMPSNLNINDLSADYGFTFDDQMFMDKNTAYIQVPVYQTRQMGMFQVQQQRMEPVTKPVIIRVDAENINSNLSISNKISGLFYMYGGRLQINDDLTDENDIRVRTLFTSSDFSWTRMGYGYGAVNENPPSSENILKKQPLGVLLEGRFKPKYIDESVPEWPEETSEESGSDKEEQGESLPEFTEKSEETKIIAIGCTNMFKSDILQSVVSHRAFLLNCVDALTLGDELINIRSKNIAARRIKNISSMGKAASKTFVIWFSPLVFIATGIYLTIRRKMK